MRYTDLIITPLNSDMTMAEYVHPDVEAIRDNPTADATVTLVVVPVGERIDAVSNLVQQAGGEIIEEVPLDMLKVRLPETAVDTLAESSTIQALHLDEEVETSTYSITCSLKTTGLTKIFS